MADYFKITTEEYEEQGDIELDDIIGKLPETVKENIQEILDDVKNNILDSLLDCESPIEQLLSIHLNNYQNNYKNFRFVAKGFDIIGIELQKEVKVYDDEAYRVDFFIPVWIKEIEKGITFIVECDGHEFHEKTKEQAQKDKERDRTLLLRGYIPIRFTGSEIYDHPSNCAEDVFDIMYKWCCKLSENGR